MSLFSSPFIIVYTKVAPPPLTNDVIYSLCFLTAYKMMSRPSVLAGMSDSKNPDPYYFLCGCSCIFYLFLIYILVPCFHIVDFNEHVLCIFISERCYKYHLVVEIAFLDNFSDKCEDKRRQN